MESMPIVNFFLFCCQYFKNYHLQTVEDEPQFDAQDLENYAKLHVNEFKKKKFFFNNLNNFKDPLQSSTLKPDH